MVLNYIVDRADAQRGTSASLGQRLMSSGPVLESFGNAKSKILDIFSLVILFLRRFL
jgi:myosin heavy subunit